ncbi:ankyrin repeat domain-containing protein [Luteimonas sp. MC1750]|uniref:ankyrin repeat domain-containing protein n=1 Tax=Luteimonas sp. MC1750 TaxID=2799326 RepID=UPI0018F0DC93|nr:ankyrin repeat domain-containing protein [Luteimonas sp. MC1750]MBJ6983985.1 ankyrin repeat domain-containing protein [Luteimonas sp. MC1750]QQO06797.1 ankyrin repeat domain-containing protein [Luteimonas sp. MC1750]
MAKRTPKAVVQHAATLLSRADFDKDRAASSAWAACRALDDLRDELPSAKAFEERLRADIGMSYAGAQMVSKVFEDRDEFMRNSAAAVASVPESEATTARLEKAHERHLADPGTRTALVRSAASNKGWEGDSMAPLLDWIHSSENGLAKTVKGEAIGWMDVYIRSGHAQKDLGPRKDDEQQTPNAALLRDVFNRMREGERVDSHEVKSALDARWKEIVPDAMRVDKARLYNEDEPTPIAYASGVPTFSMDGKGATEAGGRIDVFMPDAEDPKAWHIGFSSTSEDSRRQGDQMTRHVGGVLNGMAIGAPPFESGDHRLASTAYYAPAIVSERRAEAMGITPKAQENINRLALYAQLDDPYIRSQVGVGDAVLATAHYAIGAGKTTHGQALRPDELRDMDPKAHAKQAVAAVYALSNVDWQKALKSMGEKSGRETIIPLAQAALDGLAKHYPQILPELKKAVPHLNRLANAEGIKGTGLERDLRTTALGLKHDKGQVLTPPPPLDFDRTEQLRRHIADKQAQDSDRMVVQLALSRDVNARDEEGNTALHVAAGDRNLQLVQKLIARNADATLTNAEGQSALHIACATSARTAKSQTDQAQVVALLAPHSSIDGQDNNGNAAIHLAAAKGVDRTVGELLRHGANPSLRNGEGEKAVDLAQDYAKRVSSPNLRYQADRSAMTLEIAEQQRAMVLAQFQRQGQASPGLEAETLAPTRRNVRGAGR